MVSTADLPKNWVWMGVSAAGIYLIFFIVKFINHRRFYKNLPTPPHSMLLGNLKVVGEAMKRYPPDIHPQPMFTEMGQENNLRGLFYVDLFPFSESMVFITDPGVALQAQTSPNFYRHPFVKSFLRGVVGTKSIFSTNGAEWSRQRSWFAPSFSLAHLLKLVPGMIEESLVFKEKLTRFAVSGEVFSMNDATMKLAIDFIGRTVGDIRLKSQTEYSPIQDHFVKALSWTAGQTDSLWKKALSPFMMDWYTRKLDRMLGEVIQEKYRSGRDDGVEKSVLDLALKGYLKDTGKVGGAKAVRADLDPEFMKIALDNAKTFFVGGHDTTASLMTYLFYYLSINPTFLSRIRTEHTSIFGPSLSTTISSLTENPHLLNKLPLTSAAIKEVLRLHPVGFTVRKAAPGTTATFEGRSYPMDNHIICVLASTMHRDPAVWDRPAEFDPDRFLSPETHSVEAWMPFEKGPRNCIGQQMATLEVRVMAVLTVRYFDFEAVFAQDGWSVPGWGGKAYQELNMSAKPKDGIPMRAHLRSE
ncbi:cytochrome P450 [Cadophora sp. MPI-SDFR-AT-0126]|nr:cytochrome P450 [Leotiomycetes sp. MPI-SDFR-AT-0126]